MTGSLANLRVALVHDALVDTGGAERVVLILARMFPNAPLYTTCYKPDWTFDQFRTLDVRTSFVQPLVVNRIVHKILFPLYPMAFEQFDLSGYDLVLSSSAHWAKGVITPPETCHVCYCNSPSRVAWRYHKYVEQQGFGAVARAILPWFVHRFRQWDVVSASRVDAFVAGSQNAANRIAKYYRRESSVMRSPIDVHQFAPNPAGGDYFLVVSRLAAYKRVDVAVEAFRRLGLPLKIAGRGPMFDALRRGAPSNVECLGRVSDTALKQLYARCRALVVCAEEDYGLTPLEVNASGRPVIAYGAGGALETVVDGRTGLLFAEQTAESLIEAVRRLENISFDPAVMRAHAEQFDATIFQARLWEFLETTVTSHRARFGSVR